MKMLHLEPNTNSKKGRKVHEQVAPIPPFPPNPNRCTCVPPSAHTCGSVGTLVMTRRREKFGFGSQMGSVCRYNLKIAAALQPYLVMVLKDSGERKSSPWAELQVAHLALHFVWKNKWPKVRLYTESQFLEGEKRGCTYRSRAKV